MKKGFSLIELIGVVAVIAIITLITVPIVNETIEKARVDLYNKQINVIIESTKKWVVKNSDKLDEISTYFLFVDELLEEDFINQSDIKDPRNNKTLDGCVGISYDADYKQYQYNYIDDCNGGNNKGKILKIKGQSEALLYNSSGMDLVDYKIYGNTYQGIRKNKNIYKDTTNYGYLNGVNTNDTSIWNNNNGNGAELSGTFKGMTVVKINTQWGRRWQKIPLSQMSAGKTYTMSAYVRNPGGDDKGFETRISSYYNVEGVTYSNIKRNFKQGDYLSNNWQRISATFTIDTITDLTKFMTFRFEPWTEDYTNHTPNLEICGLQLEEGNVMTNYEEYGLAPTNDFSSPLTSLGNYNNQTKNYDIDIITTGKNLFPFDNEKISNSNKSKKYIIGNTLWNKIKGKKINLSIHVKGTDLANAEQKRFGCEMKIYQNDYWYFAWYPVSDGDVNKRIAAPTYALPDVDYETAKGGRDDLILYCYTNLITGDRTISDIQIEFGDKMTEYSNYIEPKTTRISLTNPLRCIGYSCDYIDYKNKSVVRKIGAVEFDGSVDELWEEDTVENNLRFKIKIKTDSPIGRRMIASNYFKNPVSSEHGENIGFTAWGNIYLYPVKSLLETQDINGFRKFLSTHKTEVYYQLDNDVIETISLPKIPTLNSDTLITITDTKLNSKGDFTYYSSFKE